MRIKYLKLTILLITVFSTSLFSQDRMLMMSQYVHNQYMLNSAFGGSREVLSLFGSYRQQFAGYENPPNSQSFSLHAPLKNEKIALGALIHNESYSLYGGTKANMSYTYRMFTESGTKVALSLNAGIMAHSWGKHADIDPLEIDDPTLAMFDSIQTDSRFSMGFGSAWYGKNFFLGFSVYDFFSRAPYDPDASFFSFGKPAFLFTGGYLFDVSEIFRVQPSLLFVIEPEGVMTADFSVSAILLDMLWAGGTYRTNKELVGMLGVNVTPQLRVTYSYDSPTGDLKKLSAGSHEISLQFDFGYKIITSNPKFF